jgi:hypothetical protein
VLELKAGILSIFPDFSWYIEHTYQNVEKGPNKSRVVQGKVVR